MRWAIRTSGSAAGATSPGTGGSGIPMKPSEMSEAEFVARFGPVYEASPWVAEAVWPAVRAGEENSLPALAEAMAEAVDHAPRELKLALIRAHPELASRTRMADASVQEQAGAGLDQCTPAEFNEYQRLNSAYNARI